MFTDTHCHLLFEYYQNDIQDIIKEAIKNDVNRFINSGFDYESNKEIISLANNYKNIHGTIGIHPNNVNNATDEWLIHIKENLNKKIIAIGEIGLDYYYGKENIVKQQEWFIKQLVLAEEKKLPVVIHSREATADTINILKQYKVKGVIHSFNGSLETANEYIKMGFLLGINGTITFKNCKLVDIIKNIDLKNIILETDCPYLTPEPFRGKKNYPKYIIEIAKYIAEIKKISIFELSNITNKNIKRIFDI